MIFHVCNRSARIRCYADFQFHTFIWGDNKTFFTCLNIREKKNNIFPLLSIVTSSVCRLHFSACLFKASLIGQHPQAWAGTTHWIYTSGLLLWVRWRQLWHHNLTEVLTARLKAQFLNIGCVHFSMYWVCWYTHSIDIAHRPVY